MTGLLRVVSMAPREDPASPSCSDDVVLVASLRRREVRAPAALIDAYGAHLRRVLLRVLGSNEGELSDLLQEVMVSAWRGIHGLADARALKGWLTQIAIFTARRAIRRRRRNRWLIFLDDVPEPAVCWANDELREAAACVYGIFDRMPVDERIPFVLRALEGMDLEAIAAACDMSVATVRRRLVRAEARFFKLAREFEALAPWLETK